MSPLDAAFFRRPRGPKQPRTYQVTVEYEQDHADFERAASRLGQVEMDAFFVVAARVAAWLLETVAYREDAAEEGTP